MSMTKTKQKQGDDAIIKCPKCKKELNLLRHFQSGEKSWLFEIGEDESARYEEDYFYPGNDEGRWECPECDVVLCTNEKQALQLLKGETIKAA